MTTTQKVYEDGSTITFITNNVPREIVYGYELTEKEREEFDYLDFENDCGDFVRYKGELYDLHEFEVWTNPNSPLNVGGWSAFRADTYFSGLLVRYLEDDSEYVVMGRYYA